MADTTPLSPSPATVAVQEAFDRFHADLVSELTAVCGSAGAAEAAVDEAFRRAAAMPDFAEVGRPHDWLRVTARNHVVRRPFRRDDLDGTAPPGAASFERPSLAGSLDRARRAHRRELVQRTGLGAAAAVLAVAVVLGTTSASPWASSSAPAAASATPSVTRSTPSLFPTTPTIPPTTPEPWPPAAEQIVGHADATQAYVVQSPQAADHRAVVWARCRPGASDSQSECDPENAALAVEVVDRKGHRLVHVLQPEEVVRPAFGGTFAILSYSGTGIPELVSPTMTEPKPFRLLLGVPPQRGQTFYQCVSGPCLIDLHGTVSVLDLPSDASWDSETSAGWVGTEAADTSTGPTRVFIQQADGQFSTVEVTLNVPLREPGSVYATSWPDGTVAVWASAPSGFSQVAVSADRGRTWKVRWADPGASWSRGASSSQPVVANPALRISPLRKWSRPG